MTGVAKAILNGDINSDVAQKSGENLARNVGAECYRYLQHTKVSSFLKASVWGAQLGVHWSDIYTRPSGLGTPSFVLLLEQWFVSWEYMNRVLQELEIWFAQGGNKVFK